MCVGISDGVCFGAKWLSMCRGLFLITAIMRNYLIIIVGYDLHRPSGCDEMRWDERQANKEPRNRTHWIMLAATEPVGERNKLSVGCDTFKRRWKTESQLFQILMRHSLPIWINAQHKNISLSLLLNTTWDNGSSVIQLTNCWWLKRCVDSLSECSARLRCYADARERCPPPWT